MKLELNALWSSTSLQECCLEWSEHNFNPKIISTNYTEIHFLSDLLLNTAVISCIVVLNWNANTDKLALVFQLFSFAGGTTFVKCAPNLYLPSVERWKIGQPTWKMESFSTVQSSEHKDLVLHSARRQVQNFTVAQVLA